MNDLLRQRDLGTAVLLPRIARYRFRLAAVDPIRLPSYAGSALRGVLGFGLRRTACVTRQPVCDGCLLRGSCVYSTLFESPAIGGAGRYAKLPHPFVLHLDPMASTAVEPGERFALGIHLIGAARGHMPYLIHALQLAGQRGLGKGGGRFQVARLEREDAVGSEDWQTVYAAETGEYVAPDALDTQHQYPPAPPGPVRLRLLTPLRIKRQGRLVGPAEFAAADLLRALCERLVLLAGHYGGDAQGLRWECDRGAAAQLQIQDKALRWQEWTRFSSRQDTLMQMGGLLGDLTLAGSGLAAFWPALWYGQWVHLGKGTSFGLGAYQVAGS